MEDDLGWVRGANVGLGCELSLFETMGYVLVYSVHAAQSVILKAF
jgi:hypothetical protein